MIDEKLREEIARLLYHWWEEDKAERFMLWGDRHPQRADQILSLIFDEDQEPKLLSDEEIEGLKDKFGHLEDLNKERQLTAAYQAGAKAQALDMIKNQGYRRMRE